MIEVSGLTFTYPGASAPSVQGVGFEVPAGRIFGFLGPSGAGKSTVQRVLTRLLPVQEGAVRYDGRPVQGLGRAFFTEVGVSFEHPNLFPKLTGRENLAVFASLFGAEPGRVDLLLDAVGLTEARDKPAGAWSKGMKQRLVFCRALLHQPRYLFLDEPTSGLDPATARRVMELVAAERDRGACVLLTTHDMGVADALCDDLAFLCDGRLVARGSPRALKLEHGRRLLTVEHREGGQLKQASLSLDEAADHARLKALLDAGGVETVHSREATLEQVFIRLTGRGLR